MPRVVPSQVCRFIANIPTQQAGELVRMNNIGSRALTAVLDLIDQIPDELLAMDSETYGTFILAKADIKDMLATWTANRTAGHSLTTVNLHITRNPLFLIGQALAKCPDEAPAPGTSELSFITDADLRANLRNDIGVIYRTLADGEWKAATVLAGSAAEALLLWALKPRPTAEIERAIVTLRTNSELTTKPDPNDPRPLELVRIYRGSSKARDH